MSTLQVKYIFIGGGEQFDGKRFETDSGPYWRMYEKPEPLSSFQIASVPTISDLTKVKQFKREILATERQKFIFYYYDQLSLEQAITMLFDWYCAR
jgi:hypothetical protein